MNGIRRLPHAADPQENRTRIRTRGCLLLFSLSPPPAQTRFIPAAPIAPPLSAQKWPAFRSFLGVVAHQFRRAFWAAFPLRLVLPTAYCPLPSAYCSASGVCASRSPGELPTVRTYVRRPAWAYSALRRVTSTRCKHTNRLPSRSAQVLTGSSALGPRALSAGLPSHQNRSAAHGRLDPIKLGFRF